MRKLAARILLFLLVLLPGVAPAEEAPASRPAGGSAPRLTGQQAEQLLAVLKDDRRRAAFTATLEALTNALPIAPAAPAPSATARPGGSNAGAATKPEAAPAVNVPLAPDSLGMDLLNNLGGWVSNVSGEIVTTSQTVTDFPLLIFWLQHVAHDPMTRAHIFEAAWRLGLVLACALAAERLLIRFLRHPLAALSRSGEAAAPEMGADENEDGDADDGLPPDIAPPEDGEAPHRHRRLSRAWRLLRRLPLVLARLVLSLSPLLAFLLVANLLLATELGQPAIVRLIVLVVVNAYVLCRGIMCLTRAIVSPDNSRLRLVHISDTSAAYTEIWMRRLTVVAVFGTALAQVAMLLGLYRSAHDALIKLVALTDHLFLVVIVLQCRRTVGSWLRAPKGSRGVFALLRNRFAAIWHYLAIFYIMAIWVVWAVEIRDGFSRLLHFFIVTAAIAIAGRVLGIMALGALDRGFHVSPELSRRFPGLEARANRYYPLLRGTVSAIVLAATAVALLQAWGFDALVWFGAGGIGGRLLSAAITIAISILVAVVIWESVNAAMDRHLAHLTRAAQNVRAARLRTLLPILRTSLLITILVIVTLTALSEIGINIAPLLAGAGIVGVAIGFGSQKLVQDLITGLFLLLENAMQVGDWVTVSGLSGSVETLSIRTLRLRAGDGSVHIIPFSSVTSVTNVNRGIGNAAVSVTVSFEEDTDEVGRTLKQIAGELRQDAAYSDAILDDFALWGVDRLDGATVTITGQIPCTDSGRWGVQREFNRRMKKRFQELGIEIAVPTQAVVVRDPRPAVPGNEGRVTPPGPSSASLPDSPPPAALGG